MKTKGTDQDYVDLDDAIYLFLKFEEAIRWQLAENAKNPSSCDAVIGAMRALHDGALNAAIRKGHYGARKA
jgi:hypothetical protein